MGKLDNRVAIVTGAAQGIGKAVADKLAEEGATVVGVDIQAGTTKQADVSSEDDVRRVVDETVAEHGQLDVLVNVAAIVPFKEWDDIDFAEWRRIMAVNLDGTFLTNHYASKAMRERATAASSTPRPSRPGRNAEPRPLRRLEGRRDRVHPRARARARQVRDHVNAVAPGLTATEGVMASPHKEAFEFVQMLQCIPRRGESSTSRPLLPSWHRKRPVG